MLHPDIVIRQSEIEGVGLVAIRLIPKGTIVWTLDENEPHYSLEEYLKLPPETQKYAYQFDDAYILCTDNSQYMNHSCDPNIAAINDDVMVAARDILPGDEITYDYATTEINEALHPPWECHCGAADCRRIITAHDCLDPAFQAKYEGQLAEYVLDFIRRNSLPASHSRAG